ncbi:HPP family protein [Paraburkholderia aspalathi]|jgi:CBS-domain-containing membrane protein|uniref:HPP family protein n=1 Tax=Paraburkholderia aspalathi TaxID=1324617 RepID=A0A1I7E2E3_9BURK|nr:HPP family protein [Paraburkholderia aspalathi]SFU18085.1 HPP family protein [Paraburkholderia aspalathi]
MQQSVPGSAAVGSRPTFRHVAMPAVLGFLGGTIAIAVLGTLGKLTGLPLLIAPFGASSVLLFAAPDSAFAQPRNLVFGHLIASTVGLAVFWIAGAGIWQAALAVGAAIAAMQLTRTVHPPAGADPLVIMLAGGMSPRFLILPILAGVLVLQVIALLFNNIVRKRVAR